MMPVAAALRHAAAVLAAAGIEQPRREARMLLHHALGVPERSLLPADATIAPEEFEALLARRAAREPMAFILGRQGFWTLDLEVAPSTLIPRADTESLIHAALAAFPRRGDVRMVLDLGTGTGALLLAALTEFPDAFGIGIDISAAAAALAARNARASGLFGRAACLCGSWGAALAGRFDLILANPPYIRSTDIATLMPEVAVHEPRAALDGGADGLDAYRAIVAELPQLLAADGAAVLELGQGLGGQVAEIAAIAGLRPSDLHQDLGGIARALTLRSRIG
jgi:release factor glutamine methyltransferase